MTDDPTHPDCYDDPDDVGDLDEFDDIPAPTDEDMAAAQVLAEALQKLKVWRLHARVTHVCPHCGEREGCEWLSAMYGLVNMFGGYVRANPGVAEILGIVANDKDLSALDDIDLRAVLGSGSQRRALGAASDPPPTSLGRPRP